MLFSASVILLSGMFFGWLFSKLKMPKLFGMIIAGIIIGPCVLNLIDSSILNISSELRKIALIIILIRAGLSLNLDDLKKLGRPAVLMCFLPACCEIIGMIILAPLLIGVTHLEAAVIGAVVAAVSPAVIVPKMLYLMENHYGTSKSIPQMILAGASVDDVFVIVLFYSFASLLQGEKISLLSFLKIPASIFVGIAVGISLGYAMSFLFKKFNVRDTVKMIILSAVAFMMVSLEDILPSYIPFAALIAVMSMGTGFYHKLDKTAARLSLRFNKLWIPSEIFLFVLVGVAVDIKYVVSAGFSTVILIPGVMVFRVLGVWLCMIKTNLTFKEKIFCMIAYTPKATVQAAIGGIPLAMGLECGNSALTVAVLAILITAPLGAFLIDLTYKKCLS